MPAADELGQALAHRPPAAAQLQGVVTVDPDTGVLLVNSAGVLLRQVRWTAGWAPAAGDQVRLVAFNGELVVLPRLTTPRPSTGTVTAYATASDTCTVQSGGQTFTCRFLAAYTPAVGHVVRLDWSESQPFVLGNVAAPTSTQPPVVVQAPAPPPGQQQTGVSTYHAIDSGYFSTAYGWSGRTSWGSRLMQGASGGTNTGAWFYGPAPAELDDGRTITRARVRVPRTNAYGSGGPSPARLFTHSSVTRPAGNVVLGRSAGDAVLRRGQVDWFDIPVEAGMDVVAGGGLAISGFPYLVLEGISERADSGLLELTWAR